ncbi:hypothetical protein [Bartonella tribocorum]|uniref:Uncharacterized protein n=1 Tax=Bartonella tribocorum TaxID=85701 RepID=A0A2M6UVF1_9HYPH|nr:hypothetical protein [Bartonella tribocorum]PIT70173.1 hypothetical protein CER18_00180 [Bartonella tribocorum]
MFKLAFFFIFLFPFVSYAQEKKTDKSSLISPITKNYLLTEDFLLKLEKIEKECKNLLPEIENNTYTYDSNIFSSVENYTTYISSKPKFLNILKENNLTAKSFAAGTLTLDIILMLLVFAFEKEYSSEKNIIFLKNLEFVKNHFYKTMNISGNCKRLILKN